MKNKKVLIVGLGVSGVAAIKALGEIGACIYAYDGKNEEDLSDKLNDLKNIEVKYYFNNIDFDKSIDLCVKSPGIAMETEVMQKIIDMNIPIVSDLEAAFRVTKARFIAITGTNGKTTTTTLVGDLLTKSGIRNKITGNIGFGVFYDAYLAGSDEYLVTECSSFQLNNIVNFKPFISIITNLTPDHVDWHKSVDNYYDAKFNIAKNQDENDFCILNFEDEECRKRADNLKSNKVFFSSERVLQEGIYLDDEDIIFAINGKKEKIMSSNDIFMPGNHNLENCLCAIAVAKLLNISNEKIIEVIASFKGVEHRLEFVDEIDGVKYYNDSKGTNPDASIKAVNGMTAPLILIAGGYDKKSDYTDFIKSFDGKVKKLILLGQTREAIKEKAEALGFLDISLVENMDQAVRLAVETAETGDTVLLSPACASWGMYKNYEIRGKDFKERVMFYGKKGRKS